MTIQDIECFLKLAETLNYTKAAGALYISQPAVTKHIHSLEDEIGALLFDRTIRRSIRLTPVGEILYNALLKCRDIYDEAIDEIKAYLNHPTVTINLVSGTTIPDWHVDIINQYLLDNSSIFHYVNFIYPKDFSASLERGEILLCAKELIPDSKRLMKLKISREPVPYYIIASKKHKAFQTAEDVDMRLFADTTFFLPELIPVQLQEKFHQILLKVLGCAPVESFSHGTPETITLFLRSRRSFSICTGWHIDMKSPDFRTVRLPLTTDYYAVWNPQKLINPRVLECIQKIHENL